MKVWKNASTWLTAVAGAVAGVALGGGNQLGPATAFAKYEASKLTIGGDIRVRGEFRRKGTWGTTSANGEFIQQKMRLRFNYDVSPDVKFFTELQDSRNWGSNDVGGATGNLGGNQNDIHGEALGLRQGYILVKNAGTRNLNFKIGRQKLVFGNQRIMGHFDWNNVGFSHDGVRGDYTSGLGHHAFGWFRSAELSCTSIDSGGCGATDGGSSSDFFLVYNTLKIVPGMTIEPYTIFAFDSRPANSTTVKDGRMGPDQKRHMFGTRVDGKAINKMLDYTVEGVVQWGTQKENNASPKQSISATALAASVGYTMKQMPMKPRLGFEFDFASGSGNTNDTGGKGTFENFWPTNHLHYGYMDRKAWKNMVAWAIKAKIHPTKNGNLKVHFWSFSLAEQEDNWYGANSKPQGVTRSTNRENEIGYELDIIYTHKFKAGKLALQIGYGHFFTGDYLKDSKNGVGGATNITDDDDQDWGYIQVVTKF